MNQILSDDCQSRICNSLDFHSDQTKQFIQGIALNYSRPCIMWRPKLSLDGNKWCALYGENLMEGVAGFGDSPESAMREFDAMWNWGFIADKANKP